MGRKAATDTGIMAPRENIPVHPCGIGKIGIF
jgi:hypothetical protein